MIFSACNEPPPEKEITGPPSLELLYTQKSRHRGSGHTFFTHRLYVNNYQKGITDLSIITKNYIDSISIDLPVMFLIFFDSRGFMSDVTPGTFENTQDNYDKIDEAHLLTIEYETGFYVESDSCCVYVKRAERGKYTGPVPERE